MNLFRSINESLIDRKARATDDAQVAVLRWGAVFRWSSSEAVSLMLFEWSYKWLNSMVYGRYNYSIHAGYNGL